jgi:predicted RNA-binding protein YlxR (DUF448 family)
LLATIAREETDDGLSSARKGVERLCVATRAVRPVADMLRLVAGPDGKVVPDVERKLPGRGVWITATREAAERALRERSIQRAFRGDAEVDAELPGLVDRLLERSVLEGLSLANKAGQVVTGAAKVESSLNAGAVALLIHASDAQPDGVRKIDALARAAGERLPVLRALRGEQLDLALGRPNVVHAALLAHPAGAGFLGRCLRLDRWRNGEAAVADRGTAG